METEALITVIVPVFKAENYLHRCLDSLLSQSFHAFEILLVDDGSPDRSGLICDEYARKDTRIRVFHKENGGVSSARQYGLDQAKGEYVIHVDPDDWVEPKMLEDLYNVAKKDEADMVICDFYMNVGNKCTYVQQKPSDLEHNTVLLEMFQRLHGSCCNKLVKRVCYSKYEIKFPEGFTLWEDRFVNCSLLMHDIRIAYLNRAYYHYDRFSNENSMARIQTYSGLNSTIRFIDYFELKLDPILYKRIIFNLKSHAKEYAFLLNIPSYSFVDLYREINKEYVFRRKMTLLSLFVRISLLVNGKAIVNLSYFYLYIKQILSKYRC